MSTKTKSVKPLNQTPAIPALHRTAMSPASFIADTLQESEDVTAELKESVKTLLSRLSDYRRPVPVDDGDCSASSYDDSDLSPVQLRIVHNTRALKYLQTQLQDFLADAAL